MKSADALTDSSTNDTQFCTIVRPTHAPCFTTLSAMSHLRFCRASESRDKIARQNRRCDMALTTFVFLFTKPLTTSSIHRRHCPSVCDTSSLVYFTTLDTVTQPSSSWLAHVTCVSLVLCSMTSAVTSLLPDFMTPGTDVTQFTTYWNFDCFLCLCFFVVLWEETSDPLDTEWFNCIGRLAALITSADTATDDNLATSSSLKTHRHTAVQHTNTSTHSGATHKYIDTQRCN